jgi:protein-disulfide isomerase
MRRVQYSEGRFRYHRPMAQHRGWWVVVFPILVACGGAQGEPVASLPLTPRPVPVFPGLDITDAVALGMVDGSGTAQLTVVAAIDFECPHCVRMQGPIDELVREYGGRVRFVYKNFVLPQHPNAIAIHRAGCAAGKQGKFRAFADAVRTVLRDRALSPEQIEQAAKNGSLEDLIRRPGPDLVEIARGIGLEMSAFEADRNGAWCQAFLARDHDELERLDIDALPTFFVGTRRSNAGSKDELRAAIDAVLADAR